MSYQAIAIFSLTQFIPSPTNPALQVQQNPGDMLVQYAFGWQVSIVSEHSSISGRTEM